MKNYISQLNGKEQNAVHCIKKIIATQLGALIIYCFGCTTSISIKRSAFMRKQLAEIRQFSCDLLIITPDAVTIDDEKKTEVQEMIAHFGQVNMTIHTLGFTLQQLNEGNLFFNWVHKNGMLLYNRNNGTHLLPPPADAGYWPQAEAFYISDPEMASYLDVFLQPPVIPEPKKKAASSQPLEIRLMLDPREGWQPAAPKTVVANPETPHH
ncbi:MAG: hypothetical protein QM640_17445 [Niabella sp.]